MTVLTDELMRTIVWYAPTEELTECIVNHTPKKPSHRQMPAARKPQAENGVFTAQAYFSANTQQAERLIEIGRCDPMKN